MKTVECPVCKNIQPRNYKYCSFCGYKFKKVFSKIVFVLFLAAFGASIYYSFLPCTLPIKYSVGNIDAGLDLSKDDAKADLLVAETNWEVATGYNLFEYDESSFLKIDFVYSDEQKGLNEANIEIAKLGVIDPKRADAYDQLTAAFAELDKDLTDYNAALKKHNDNVAYWMTKGGAPEPYYTQITNELIRLNAWSDKHEQRRVAVQKTQDEYNKKMKLRDDYSKANSIEQYVSTMDFSTSGLNIKTDTDSRIKIFTYDSKEELILLLTHELGHELTRNHAKEPTSLMYPVMNDKQTGKLTDEDVKMFCDSCNVKKK